MLDNLKYKVNGKPNIKPDYLHQKNNFIKQNYQNKNQLKIDGIKKV